MMYQAGGRKIRATAEQRIYEFKEARIDLFGTDTRRIRTVKEVMDASAGGVPPCAPRKAQ